MKCESLGGNGFSTPTVWSRHEKSQIIQAFTLGKNKKTACNANLVLKLDIDCFGIIKKSRLSDNCYR